MPKYRIWFEQINAQVVEVDAKDRESAIVKATKIARPDLEDMRVVGVVRDKNE